MTNLKCLASGSTGNCYILNVDDLLVILDAGCDWIKMVGSVNLNDVDLAYISHEHKDHSLNYEKLILRGVYCLDGINTQEIIKNQIKSKNGGLFQIFRIPIRHGNVKNCALVIKNDNECILYATDFNLCEYDLSVFKFTRILIECNYLEKIVNVCDDKVRRENNIDRHMGLEGVKIILDKLDLSKCQEIDLIHLSSTFSDSIIMGSTIYSRYKIKTGVCKQFGGIEYYG
jgi:ribonuclease BN (tRNA processing enzyme)